MKIRTSLISLSLAVAFIAPFAEAQTTTLPAPVSATTSTSTEDLAPVIPTEEARGIIEAIDERLITLAPIEEDGSNRKIRLGNAGSIMVMRDGEQSAVEEIAVGDAAIVKYSTEARYLGDVVSVSETALVVETTDGRMLSFVPGEDLEVTFEIQRGVKATGPGVFPVVAGFRPGTEIEVGVDGESIVSIEAYSNGEFPNPTGWIVPVLLVIIALILVAILVSKSRKKKEVTDNTL